MFTQTFSSTRIILCTSNSRASILSTRKDIPLGIRKMAPRKEKTEKATADQGGDKRSFNPGTQDLTLQSRDCNDN